MVVRCDAILISNHGQIQRLTTPQSQIYTYANRLRPVYSQIEFMFIVQIRRFHWSMQT